MKLIARRKTTITRDSLSCAGLFFFLVKGPVRALLATLLHTPAVFNTWISIALMYLPILFLPFLSGKKRKIFDFCLVWLFMFLSCMITYLIHPDYSNWLFEGEFNIWQYIFRPDQAIYLYLFIRLVDDPVKMFETLKRAAFLLLAYNLYKFIYATFIRGYWEPTGIYRNVEGVKGGYNLAFGYDVLFLFVIFMVLGKRNNNKWYYGLSGISLLCILMAGSRGPLLGVTLILLLQLWDRLRRKPMIQRILLLFLFATAAIFVLVYFSTIMMGVALLLQKLGISSRTVMSIINGTITDDSGRGGIYRIALDLIRTGGPFGNGIYGDRVVISSVTMIWVGYCHEFFLEILVDYGWLFGGLLLILMAIRVVKILSSKDSEWRRLFIIFLVSASQLILSGSYLYSSLFWGCLAIGVCWSERHRTQSTVGEQISI